MSLRRNFENMFRTWPFVLLGIAFFASGMAEAAEMPAVTVQMTLGSIGTGAELILCPMVGKKVRDPNWMYQTLPDGTLNPGFPPLVQTAYQSPVPPIPAASDLSQTWVSWDVSQNTVVDSPDQQVPMDVILFDPIASTAAGVASGGVVIYVDSEVSCSHQDNYRAYLASKGIKYTQIERDSLPDYGSFVGGLNYLSPGGNTIPLLLISGEAVVGKWSPRTRARIDSLLKKHGITP